MKSALTIASSDPSGGAGVSADLRTFSYVGLHGCFVLTNITSQNTKEVREIFSVPLKVIETQLDAVLDDIKISSCKTGMLYSPEIVNLVAKKVKNHNFPLVVDPVMKATVGGDLVKRKFVQALKKSLIPKATLLTPNIHEAETLLSMKIDSIDDMKSACEKIHKLDCRNVLLKGGHLKEEKAVDVLYDGNEFHLYLGTYHPKEVHGSGCVHSALICAYLAIGLNVKEAISESKIHISNLIESAYSIGGGVDIAGMALEPSFLPSELEVIEKLKPVVFEIIDILPMSFVPEVGINLGYALSHANDLDDVCALEGRLHRVGGRIGHIGGFKFGASKHIARIILTAMKYDPNIRSAMNIRYIPDIVESLSKLDLAISSFDRESEPKEISSMEWGTETAIKELGKVPDIISDKGGMGKEPMIRILGNDPGDVLGKLKKIVENFKHENE